jgi:rieske iron-sulfur protein
MADDNSSETPADQPEEAQGTITEGDDGDLWYEPPEMSRRDVAKWLGAFSGAAVISSILISSIAGLSDAGLVQFGSNQIYTQGTYLVDKTGKRLQVSSALPKGKGKTKLVLPEANQGKAVEKTQATTLLIRYTEDAYQKPTHLNWTVNGYAAYSMVCTHAGCLVGSRSDENLLCPCHRSIYDPKRGAEVVGGPAPRPLPQLPIGASKNGELLIATGPFEGPIGPQ